jgi:hypothetical protein
VLYSVLYRVLYSMLYSCVVHVHCSVSIYPQVAGQHLRPPTEVLPPRLTQASQAHCTIVHSAVARGAVYSAVSVVHSAVVRDAAIGRANTACMLLPP